MSKPEKIQAEKLIGQKEAPKISVITERDSIIYSLGIGFSQGTLFK